MKPRAELSWLLVLLAAGAGLRFFQLGEESLWHDEWYSLNMAMQPDFASIVRLTSVDSHPALYYCALRIWGMIFAPGPASIRALSAVLSLAILPVYHRLARRLTDPPTALIATAMMALSPYQIYYAQEARMYSMLVLLEVVMLASAIAVCDGLAPDAPSRPDASEAPRGALPLLPCAALILSTAAVMHTHFYFIFAVTLIGAFWLFRAWRAGRGWWRLAAPMAGWIAASLLAGAPAIVQLLRRADTVHWVPPVSLETFHGIVNAFAYGVMIRPDPEWIIWPLAAAWGLALISGIAAGWLMRRDAARGDTLLILLLWGVCMIGLPVLVSLVWRPIVYFGQRYEIGATPPYYLLCAMGFVALHRALRGRFGGLPALGASAALLAVIAAGMIRYHWDSFDSRQKRPYDIAAKFLDARFRPGDLIVFNPPSSTPTLAYYVRAPFEYLPADQEASLARLRGAHARTAWFVSITDKRTPLEEVALREGRRGPAWRGNLVDAPEEIIRATPYFIP